LLNPSGMCECGCGQVAPIAKRANRKLGHVKGEPVRYVAGHQGRWMGPRYDARDCGYETPCWVWLLRCDDRGYGRAGGKLAHRVMYEAAKGRVDPVLDLHHKCNNPACVNPDHLEPLTRREHAQFNRWAVRTHCDYGHPFDEANTYYPPNKRGRACRRCMADRAAEYKARKQAA
jgi:hypothetical protein